MKACRSGCKVTLLGTRMYQFLDQVHDVALPRSVTSVVFRTSVRRSRQLRCRLKEQLIFPEIEYDKIDKIRGMNIVIVTTAQTDEEARELLKLMGMPFKA